METFERSDYLRVLGRVEKFQSDRYVALLRHRPKTGVAPRYQYLQSANRGLIDKDPEA